MQNLKKLSAILLAITVLASLAACSKTEPQPAQPEPVVETAAAEAPAPAKVYADGLAEDGKIHVYLVGAGEHVPTPESSFIEYITYYKSCEHLIICMNGKDYVYANVSQSLWDAFKAADSKGKFYNANLKGQSQYYVKDYDGTNGDLIVMENVD